MAPAGGDPGEVLDRLRRKDLGWWGVPGRMTAARALAQAWVEVAGVAPSGVELPWPRPHGIADLLTVLLQDCARAGVDPGVPAWLAAREAWRL